MAQTDVVIKDSLHTDSGDLLGMYYIPSSFVLREVKMNTYGEVISVISSRNVENEILFNAQKSEFTFNMGNLPAGKQWQLMYQTTYVPGVTLKNKVSYTSTNLSKVAERQYISSSSSGTGSGTLNSKIKIFKVDKSDPAIKLQNATFRLTNLANGTTFDITTDTTGEATSPLLTPGSYTVQEISAPPGYILNTEVKTITVSATEPAFVSFTNTKAVGKIELTKSDAATAVKLTGAEFEVKDANGAVVDHLTTDANGIATSRDLPLGSYTLVETKAPAGHELDQTPIPTAIGTHREVVKIEAKNVLSVGKIELTKSDAATAARLKDAEFEVKDATGTVVDRLTTDENGIATSRDLPLGSYTLVETKAPVGYELDATPIPATIGTHREVVKIEATNVLSVGKIRVSKYDSETNKRLSGMIFKLKNTETGMEKVIKMEEKNTVDIENLPLGIYEITEITAPDGYNLDKTAHIVQLERHNDIKNIDIYDKRKPETPGPKTGVEFPISLILISISSALIICLMLVYEKLKKDKKNI